VYNFSKLTGDFSSFKTAAFCLLGFLKIDS